MREAGSGFHYTFDFPSFGSGDYSVRVEAPQGVTESHVVVTTVETDSELGAAIMTASGPLPAGRPRALNGALFEASAGRKKRIGDLDTEIAKLEGGIESAGGDGLGEKVQTLREQRELASREVQRRERRSATLKLLKSTVEACFQEQREQLHAPLLRHLQPFLHDVFPSAELKLGDGYTVEGLRRNGPDAENFEQLSDGTKEQIAVLVRLAMGAMLCERGQEAPILLDDALVFSDDTRIEQMFNALTRAGKNQQVIIFTCRTRTFETLGGRPLTIVKGVA